MTRGVVNEKDLALGVAGNRIDTMANEMNEIKVKFTS